MGLRNAYSNAILSYPADRDLNRADLWVRIVWTDFCPDEFVRKGCPNMTENNNPEPRHRVTDISKILEKLDNSFHRARLGPPGDPSKHLPELLAKVSERGPNILDLLMEDLKKQLPEENFPTRDSVLSDPEWFWLIVEMAIHLDREHATDRAIEAAFRAANLDPKNPLNWRVLMEMFCWAHFGKKGDAGAPRVWTDERYCELLHDVEEVKTKASVKLKDVGACKELRSRYKEKYGNLTVERLRRALREARDPNHNRRLRRLVYTKALAQQENDPASTEDERADVLKQLAKDCCAEIATNWSAPTAS
jgi:hypothetical protein